jgi:PAS domain S-box-containing protein
MGVDFSRVIDALPGLVWTALADGFIDFVNQRWCEYTGLSLENAYGWGWQTAICPEDLPGLLERWRSILASGVPGEFEARLRRFDGEYRRFLVCTSALRDATGQIVKWCGVSTDVEDRRRAEEALRARERFRVIVDDLPAMVTLMTPDGEFAEGNRHMREYFGAPLEELKRRPTTYSFHPDDRPSVDAQWKESVETGRPYDFEARLRRADGTYRWFHTRGFPLRDAEGRIVLWHLLQTDVDDRKRAEDALRASERNLKLIIDTIPALAWSARPDGSARFFSQHYLDFMGLSAEQASDWGWTVAVHPDDMNGLAATWQRIMASEALGEAEARLHRRDGEYRWFLFRANPLRDESGAIVKWYGVNTDIEDRKQAEDALRRSETFLLEVQRLSHTGGWRYDVATGTVESSPEILRGYAVQPGEDVSKPPFRFDRIHPDDRARVQAQFERSVREKTEYRAAYRIVLPDGSIRYQHVTGHPVISEMTRANSWNSSARRWR